MTEPQEKKKKGGTRLLLLVVFLVLVTGLVIWQWDAIKKAFDKGELPFAEGASKAYKLRSKGH